MKVIRNIVYSNIPPKNTNDLWLKSIAEGEYELCLYTQIPKEDYPTYGRIKRWVPIKTALQNSSNSVFVDDWYVRISTEEFSNDKISLNDFVKNNVYVSNNPIVEISENKDYYVYVILRNDYKIQSITQKSIEGEGILFGTKDSKINNGQWEIINTEYIIGDSKHTLYKFKFNIESSVISIDINIIRDLQISDFIVHDTGTYVNKTMSQWAISNNIQEIAADFDGFITLDIKEDNICDIFEDLYKYDHKIYFATIKDGEEIQENTFLFYSEPSGQYYRKFEGDKFYFKYDPLEERVIRKKLYKFENNYFYYANNQLLPVGETYIKIEQEFGYAEDRVISQKTITEKIVELESFLFPKKLTIYTENPVEYDGNKKSVTICYNYTQQRGENHIDFPLYYLEVLNEDNERIEARYNILGLDTFIMTIEDPILYLKFRYKETEDSEFIEKEFIIQQISPYYYGFYKNMDIDESNIDELFEGLNKGVTIPFTYPYKHIESSTEEHCCFYVCYAIPVSNITLTSSGLSVPLQEYRVLKTIGDSNSQYIIYKSGELQENKIENVILKFE